MIINKYFPNYSKEDLYQVGVIGVIKAYNNYKDNSNTKFSTYAYKYIYGEIYSYINSLRLLKINKENIALYKKILEAKNILSQQLMKVPSNLELSMFLEIDINIIENVIRGMSYVESLEDNIYNDNTATTLSDTISDNKDYYNIENIMLNDIINNLPYPDKDIIKLRYFEDKTQSEIAGILGINQVEVSRTEKKILKRIKDKYQNVA